MSPPKICFVFTYASIIWIRRERVLSQLTLTRVIVSSSVSTPFRKRICLNRLKGRAASVSLISSSFMHFSAKKIPASVEEQPDLSTGNNN